MPRRHHLILRNAFRRLDAELPGSVGAWVRWFRHPRSFWIRLPLALLLVLGGILSFLPVLGLWMLPVGLLLLAQDVPLIRPWVARCIIRLTELWARARARWAPGRR